MLIPVFLEIAGKDKPDALRALLYHINMEMREVLSQNLRMLLTQAGWSESELGRRAGVSPRTINAITNMKSNASIGVLTKLSAPFGLEPWQLLLPYLPDEPSLQARIEDLIRNYCAADPEVHGFVDYVLQRGKH